MQKIESVQADENHKKVLDLRCRLPNLSQNNKQLINKKKKKENL